MPLEPPEPTRGDGLPGGAARLSAVRRIVDAVDHAAALDRLTRLAARLLAAPHAQVLLLGDEQVVASQFGKDTAAAAGEAVDALCARTVLLGEPVAVLDVAADVGLGYLPPDLLGRVGAFLGAPLVDHDGLVLGCLCVFTPRPRAFDPQDVVVLAEMAESIVDELELRALTGESGATAARLGLALSAAAMGSFDLDLDRLRLVLDDRLALLVGLAANEPTGLAAMATVVHPEDRARLIHAVAASRTRAEELAAEFRLVRADGSTRWCEARGRVLPRRKGRGHLVGVAYDSTDAREARDSLDRVLETTDDGLYRLDAALRFTYVNRAAERILGRSRTDLLGVELRSALPHGVGSSFAEAVDRCTTSGERVVIDAWSPAEDAWYDLAAWPGPDGVSVSLRDITARKRAEGEREQAVVERARAYAVAEAANSRLALLASASTRLAESLEPRQVLDRLAEVVLPELGRWLVVTLTAEIAAQVNRTELSGDPDALVAVHVAHADPSRRELLVAMAQGLSMHRTDHYGPGRVITSGRPEWAPAVAGSALRGLLGDHSPQGLLDDARLTAALTVPLANHGRVLGALTVAEPAGEVIDRSLLLDLAGRAAGALDNALLYGRERRGGVTLQRSLLPRELPRLPGVTTAARYLPGASGAFVGGDWFQGVLVEGRVVLAMGDVMGHGLRSAARMGQLRAIVATLALEGHRPARLLTRLAANVDVLLDLELATLLVADYDPSAGMLTVASAGHPPVLHVPFHGAPRFLDDEPGPPLGSIPYRYVEHEVAVHPGDTLVLYTDGLVEQRDVSLDAGLERLRSCFERVGLPPEQLCDHVLSATGHAEGGDDDIALLVVGLDRPGPGPDVGSSRTR